MRRPLSTWSLRAAAMLAAIVMADLALHAIALASPAVAHQLRRPWERATIIDDRLGYRFSPFVAGHDAAGHRNERVPERCDVLALGDSWTYGYGVPASAAWPALLARHHDIDVYNAGVGGYSPLHATVTLEAFAELPSRAVVFALYVGNDLSDAYRAVCEQGLFPEFATPSDVTRARPTLHETALALDGDEVDALPQSLPKRLPEHSAIFRLLRSVWHDLARGGPDVQGPWSDSFRAAALRPNRYGFAGESRFRTVFATPHAKRLALDLSDPRIRRGFELTIEAVRELSERVRAQDLEFIVAILPTKYAVYAAGLEDGAIPDDPALARMLGQHARAESRVRAELLRRLDDLDITSVDALPEFVRRLRLGAPPFHASDDGHPTESGQLAIADALAPAIARALRSAPSTSDSSRPCDAGR